MAGVVSRDDAARGGPDGLIVGLRRTCTVAWSWCARSRRWRAGRRSDPFRAYDLSGCRRGATPRRTSAFGPSERAGNPRRGGALPRGHCPIPVHADPRTWRSVTRQRALEQGRFGEAALYFGAMLDRSATGVGRMATPPRWWEGGPVRRAAESSRRPWLRVEPGARPRRDRSRAVTRIPPPGRGCAVRPGGCRSWRANPASSRANTVALRPCNALTANGSRGSAGATGSTCARRRRGDRRSNGTDRSRGHQAGVSVWRHFAPARFEGRPDWPARSAAPGRHARIPPGGGIRVTALPSGPERGSGFPAQLAATRASGWTCRRRTGPPSPHRGGVAMRRHRLQSGSASPRSTAPPRRTAPAPGPRCRGH